MSIKVIAIGNILMKDDAIGIQVAKEIKKKFLETGIEVILGETDVQYSLSKIEEDDYLIVLDAASYGKNPGDITKLPLNSYKSIKKEYSQHSYSFLDLLQLYYYNIKGEVYGIEVKDVEFGFGLSYDLQQKFEKICKEIALEIERFIKMNEGEQNMHDTVLLNKISDLIEESCKINRIKKVNILTLILSEESHIVKDNLLEHLKSTNNTLFGEWTKIDIYKENLQDQTAVINSIQGEQYDD